MFLFTLLLYGMEKKVFESRLFKRKIAVTEKDYWQFLYAETLFHIKQLEDLNCRCDKCAADRIKFKRLIEYIHKDDHIPPNPKPLNFAGVGYCERK